MKSKYLLAIVLVLLLSLSSPNVILATTNQNLVSEEITQAQKSGQSFISNQSNIFPEWEGASLVGELTFQNLEGQVNAYMFSIQKNNQSIGRIVVGSKLYEYDIFEAGSAAIPLTPGVSEIQAAATADLGISASVNDIRNPRLIYLGYDKYFSVYNIQGTEIAFDLRTRQSVMASKLREYIPTSSQYQMARDGFIPNGIDSLLFDLLEVQLRGQLDPQIDEEMGAVGCAPTSGAMIAEYYKYMRYYGLFYDWPNDFETLFETMETGEYGTAHTLAGPGFIDYAALCEYVFDTHYEDADGYYDDIQTQISWQQPMMILFGDVPYAEYHYCVIRGYYYDTEVGPPYIIINNPASQYGYWDYVNWTANSGDSKLIWLEPD